MKDAITSALKRIPLVKKMGHAAKEYRMDQKSISVLRKERRIRRPEAPIKVGFLCQYLPGWTKVESVYQMMKEDPRFEPYLICVPSGIRNKQLADLDSTENDTYDYFLEHGYSEAKNALIGKNQWLDLETMGLAYIFYPRPYNAFMPPQYGTDKVAAYSRVCLVMYGIESTKGLSTIALNRQFMAYTAYYFAEHRYVADINISNNRRAHDKGLQQTLCLGLPYIEAIEKMKDEVSASWDFSKNDFRVIWTPRWTTAKEEGGSNFFHYYQYFLDLAKEYPDMDFLFRPHPLALAHFVETGEMTQQQVDDYLAAVEGTPNTSMDREPQYEATLWGSSVMVSDISGIMPEFFCTGKPLIYCASNMTLPLAEFGEKMVKGCYVVNNKQELYDCLMMLRSGVDPMKEKRQEVLGELFEGLTDGATARILDKLATDYHK